ncbi:hypothetical protein P8605_08920 [Streptomyces sp. T-3]|nr:hypothetical protein [Streptomyces sp. T-3]
MRHLTVRPSGRRPGVRPLRFVVHHAPPGVAERRIGAHHLLERVLRGRGLMSGVRVQGTYRTAEGSRDLGS